ncbi:hypothetical protein CY34DRAFT_798440 [Suillus luteus UH-Slu-Lm8-n1]|uniref:Uncharacterized protein n=1 Tax=Suillus luteus UH-Slu-Lm8-n1 TaxID=930992 RepID=A0A0D0ADL0_9AGAM|nr:hypothetical protein CY34DRAFT_798440 [Suillus luteus UH-Slu-Lm8-n1]
MASVTNFDSVPPLLICLNGQGSYRPRVWATSSGRWLWSTYSCFASIRFLLTFRLNPSLRNTLRAPMLLSFGHQSQAPQGGFTL